MNDITVSVNITPDAVARAFSAASLDLQNMRAERQAEREKYKRARGYLPPDETQYRMLSAIGEIEDIVHGIHNRVSPVSITRAIAETTTRLNALAQEISGDKKGFHALMQIEDSFYRASLAYAASLRPAVIAVKKVFEERLAA